MKIHMHIKPHYKPVFDQEKAFYEKKLGIPIPQDSWFYKQQIFHEGRLYCSFKISDHGLILKKVNMDMVKEAEGNIAKRDAVGAAPKALVLYPNVPASMPMLHELIEKHKSRLLQMEKEAVDFIRRVNDEHQMFKYIGFSSGKDSMVVAELVRRSLGKIPILHNDTTIEIPDTAQAIQRFQAKYDWPITVARHKRTFYEELAIHSFPSARQRWCCAVMKNDVIMKYVNGKPTVAFLGIRAQESPLRSRRARIDKSNPYMKNQIAAHPILKWSTLDVWLYTFFRSLLINDAYRKGFARIGCFLCPEGSLMNHLLMDYYYPALWQGWLSHLSEFIDYRHGIKDIPFRRGEKWVHTASRTIKAHHIKCAACRRIICWKGKHYNRSRHIPKRRWSCLTCHAKKQGIPKRYLRRVIDKRIIRNSKFKHHLSTITSGKEVIQND